MAQRGVADPADFRARLEADPCVLDDLVGEVTVGETYFFREPAQFDLIRREILPELRARRGLEHAPRIWSAGCASGEEAYSLAILAEEVGLAGRTRILATDISRAALARAHAAVYGHWSLRGADEAFTRRYFRPAGSGHTLADRFRPRVTFGYLNLALDVYPALAADVWGMDLILCRNVLIYFGPETVARVARQLSEALAEGGWLLTSASDPPLAACIRGVAIATPIGTVYRRLPRTVVPVAEPLPDLVRVPIPAPTPIPIADPVPIAVPDPVPLTAPAARPGPPPLTEAEAALASGDYARAADLALQAPDGPAARALRLRALANLGRTAEARTAAEEAVARYPLVAELHYLRGIVLLDQGQAEAATDALRRALYLDRSLAVVHFTLGSVLARRGDRTGARRACRNALRLCSATTPDMPLALGDGESAGRLAEAARAQLVLLGDAS